jgi:hypothetical protein
VFGQFGCDSPDALVNIMIKKASESKDTDILIVNGDFPRHEISSPVSTDEMYGYLKEAIRD